MALTILPPRHWLPNVYLTLSHTYLFIVLWKNRKIHPQKRLPTPYTQSLISNLDYLLNLRFISPILIVAMLASRVGVRAGTYLCLGTYKATYLPTFKIETQPQFWLTMQQADLPNCNAIRQYWCREKRQGDANLDRFKKVLQSRT